MTKIGKYVVYWEGGGTNTHHYFDTFDEAKGYCQNTKTNPKIAYVIYSTSIEANTSPQNVLKFLEMQKKDRLTNPKEKLK